MKTDLLSQLKLKSLPFPLIECFLLYQRVITVTPMGSNLSYAVRFITMESWIEIAQVHSFSSNYHSALYKNLFNCEPGGTLWTFPPLCIWYLLRKPPFYYQGIKDPGTAGPDSYQAVLGQPLPPLICTCLFSAGWIEDVSQIHPLLNQTGNNENIVQ